ncbi:MULTISPECIES: RadC family protein [Pseudomonadota]|uniref:RadC family protein n=1 Tax=Pseudomonadota TaxID=1224 RepID=UPI0025FDCF43|nr:DNA repair protein RadC [Pigmentiphaga sp.]
MSLTTLDAPTVSDIRSPTVDNDRIIEQAIAILERRIFATGPRLTGLEGAREYLRLKLLQEPNEVFVVVFLTTRHRVIACEALFRGTIDGAEVHPRVVVQRALALNAAALIVAHQHPSGDTTPSAADRAITNRLKDALSLVDIRLLDHFIIGKGTPYSFAASGLL